MRSDLAKKLVETHRHGGHGDNARMRRRRSKQRDPEDLPQKEGMRSVYGWNRKEFGENFPPLKGILRKNVGRPWSKVFSEMCDGLHGGGTVIDHTRLHLFRDFLDLHPDYSTGKPMQLSAYRGLVPFTEGEWYVDRVGILREGRRQPERAPKKVSVIRRVHINTHEFFMRYRGDWYHVWAQRVPYKGYGWGETAEVGSFFVDALLGKFILGEERGYKRTYKRWNKSFGKLRALYGVEKDKLGDEHILYALRAYQVPKREIRQEGLHQIA